MAAPLRIARVTVVVNNVEGYARGVLRGVMSFASARSWECDVRGINVPLALESPGPVSGMIVQASSAETLAALRESAVPAVNVSSALPSQNVPSVVCDDLAVGRLGAEHFLRRGYRLFAFFAPLQRQFAKLRHEGFASRLLEAGLQSELAEDAASLARCLFEWPKPLAVMACNDASALAVLQQCRADHHRVPDDVAVLGVDNDDLMLSLATPALSSVNTATERIGFEAAAMLDQLMRRQRPQSLHRFIAPAGIVTRQSTDVLAIHDRDVVEAVRFIRAHAARNIGVDDILRSVTISRRQLERRFRASLGRSVLDEIRRCRIERARQLLSETELTLDQVALASGFNSASYFNVVFRQAVGTTPGEFRGSATTKRRGKR